MNRTSVFEPLETRKMIVREFFDLIDTIPNSDAQETVQKFLRYLQGVLRIKQVVPPTVEIMTVVKQSKPFLYHAARRSVLRSSNLYMLFQVEMDLELAKERLEQYTQQ
ncbi:hypothetical protein [Brevibacillus choshinensis]|uniref:Uncharacterized protein n=1 Tax=Brevibacillus choshinensis TaxID=54911 RepID=A0ABX7FIZ3_BRECH|nr:hypothetical protein [Brevibacillus choshinensis]QRG65594.1 hypothetical protein JNE38_18500 [Brevibacillus choshinensis]